MSALPRLATPAPAPASARGPDLDLLVFEIGSSRFGCDAMEVLRIGPREPGTPAHPLLGMLARGCRALVVRGREGVERSLPIDRVLGVQRIARAALRPLPALARITLASDAPLGVMLQDKDVLVLLDVAEAIEEARRPRQEAKDAVGKAER